MIRYALVCGGGHDFESWFRDSGAFDALSASGELHCPVCGSATVRKALMAPSVVSSRRKAPEPAAANAEVSTRPAPAPVLMPEPRQHLRAALRALREQMIASSDDVGRDFAAEARRIHEGDAPERSIHGEASRAEVEDLLDDGIPFLPLPPIPDDH